jgi:LEA14-like dessication related protein
MDEKKPAGGYAAALAIAFLVLVSGCATRKPAPMAFPPSASLESLPAIASDQYRLSLPFTLVVRNPGLARAWIESVDFMLSIEGAAAGSRSLRERSPVEGGGSKAIALALPVDIRNLGEGLSGSGGPPSAAWRLEARIWLTTGDGSPLALAASEEGSFAIVREPLFSLRSIKIERDLLVTTNLRLAVEIGNPNDFPLVFDALSYDFFGEGKGWAAGEDEGPVAIPARGSIERSLRFTMNFADMDRRLFDLVANLRIVRYRIAGEARIATGLDYLPAFVMRFDREGSCAVER